MYYRRLFFLFLLTCDVRWHYVYSTRAALLRSHIPHCDRKKYHDGMTHREDCQPHMPKHAQLSSTFAALGNGLPTQRSTPTQSLPYQLPFTMFQSLPRESSLLLLGLARWCTPEKPPVRSGQPGTLACWILSINPRSARQFIIFCIARWT